MNTMAEFDGGPPVRPRSKSMLSSESKKSHKSRGSSGSHNAEDKVRITGKADPSTAISEIQPSAMSQEKPTMENMRRMSYLKRDGTPIQRPDASNPTREAGESPLETIRSFERDIERTYREKSVVSQASRPASRGDMFSASPQSRRASGYFGGYGGPNSQVGGYYQRPASGYGGYYGNGGNDVNNDQQRQGYNRPGHRGSMMSRGFTEPANHIPHYQQSPDTVGTRSSPETDGIGVSTGPSSQNSSMDKFPGMQQAKVSMAGEYQISTPAPVQPRVPIKLSTGVDNDGGYNGHVEKQKRKSRLSGLFGRSKK